MELDRLECIFAARVSEEDLLLSEEELHVSEVELNVCEESAGWVSLEEQLLQMYYRYISPESRCGMETEDIIRNMRTAIQLHCGDAGAPEKCEAAILLEAGRDAYERRMSILQKLRQTKHPFGVDIHDFLSRVVGGTKRLDRSNSNL